MRVAPCPVGEPSSLGLPVLVTKRCPGGLGTWERRVEGPHFSPNALREIALPGMDASQFVTVDANI